MGRCGWCRSFSATPLVNVYRSKGYRGNSTGFLSSTKTPGEIFDYYLALGINDVQLACGIAGKLKRGHMPNPSVMAAQFLVCHQLDGVNGEAVDFFEAVATGANLGVRSIPKKLRDYLLREGKELKPSKVAGVTNRAWNAVRAGRRSFSTAPVTDVPQVV